MKSKLFLFPIFIILSVLLASNVSAIVVYGDWESGSQSIQIDKGESVNFNGDFFSMTLPMTINIKLYDSSDNLIHSFESNKVVNTYGYYNVYTITENIYETAGNFEIILTGSDTFPDSDSHTILLTVEDVSESNNPPEITSVPITEVDENALYEYQVVATDLDDDALTYSLSVAPNWLSINSDSGLITGTAPEVDEDTDFNVSVIVSDGTDTDTQSYVLTVKYVLEPFLSQTVELVDYVNAEYHATLSELDSAILKIYYKEFDSTHYGTEPIITREITTSPYTETFDFYEIHGATKGDYRFVIKDPDSDSSDTDEIAVPDYTPEVDLSSIPDNEKNFNEEDSSEINLPVPTDKNPEDNPVAYISATSLDNKVSISLDSENNLLTVTGNRDKIGAYTVELRFGDFEGEQEVATIEGHIYNLLDVSGVLENNEEDVGEQGIIRVYYQDPDNSSNYLVLEIDKINDGEGSIIDASLGKIQTASDGRFNFQINKKASELEILILQARIGTSENYIGYVRTIELSGDDNLDVLVRAVPYAPYEDNPQIFRQFISELAGDRLNTRFDFDGSILRGINPGFEDYEGLIGIEILSENPFGAEYGTFTLEQQNNIKNKILDQNDISGIIGNYRITEEQIFLGNYGHYDLYDRPIVPGKTGNETVIAHSGWIVVVPYLDMWATGLADARKAGTIAYKGTIYLKPVAGGGGSVISHEFGHIFIGSGHPISMPRNQTIMSTISILQITGPADKKAGKLIYEETFMTIHDPLEYPGLDVVYNILGLGFYGESQITWTVSENPFEAEEDEEEDFTDSTEEDVIGSDDIDSTNDVSVNTPYEETIYLQSDVGKNNIITSLSDILKQVISFISQKFKEIFAM